MFRRYMAVIFIASALIFAIFIGNGCGRNKGDEPTKYRSQAGLEKLTAQAAQTSPDNPKFFTARSITPANATAKDIDSLIRPVLVKMFKDAKLISAKGPEAPQKDGEVVEDRLVYAVRKAMARTDGDRLHGTLHSMGFAYSPRLGSKPTHLRARVYMSLMKTTRLRGYSFVIIVDTQKQQIEVESYKLGSKYDRLM